MTKNRVLVGAVVLTLAGLAGAGGAQAAEQRTDAQLLERVEREIERARLDDEASVDVTVENGQVRLAGVATTLRASREAERRALKVADAVANEIRVMPEEKRSAREIRQDVAKAIRGYAYYTIFDNVELAVSDSGVVRLEGSVRAGHRSRDIERRVEKVRGVRAIENELRVQSASIFDERLRLQIARAIYGDPRFVQYGARANPPIHIVVEDGRVTLAGAVASPVERAVLGSIARGFMSFGVDNRLEVDGERPEEPGSRTRS